jgi:transglutaminase/protease-like cytokinesis protein 3
MLRYAGITAEIINGRADAFDGWGDHAWNKIKFIGEDLYVDTTWNSGYIENGKYIKNLSEAYYLIPKGCLIVDHVLGGEKEMNTEEQKQYVRNNISLFEVRCPSLKDLILYK